VGGDCFVDIGGISFHNSTSLNNAGSMN